MKEVFRKIRDIWSAKDIRSKLLFTGFILLLYRLGAAIPVPYVNDSIVTGFQQAYGGTVLEYLNLLSGTALAQATLFALSISPYITAQIVLQLLTVAIPKLQTMSKEEDGQKKIAQYTRILTIALALLTSFAYFQILKNNKWLIRSDFFAALVIIACFTAGASIIMWLGEKINENGIGNGISMILFANILSGLPSNLSKILDLFTDWGVGTALAVIAVIVLVLMIIFIVYVTNSERRIPIQYAKRVVGRKMYGGQNTSLPIKLNMTGVMPIIFASSIVSLPATICAFAGVTKDSKGFWGGLLKTLDVTSPIYIIAYLGLIIAFSYFYILISFDPVEVSNNLKRNGGTVQGIRPGAPTADYIKKILNRVTLIGAFFLIIVAGLPMIVNSLAVFLSKFDAISKLFDATKLSGLAFGGSSLLIVVGVALETYRDIEAQMSMRHYKGFLQ